MSLQNSSLPTEYSPRSLNPLPAILWRWLNRDLRADRTIELRIVWPLWLIPLLFVNQLFAPHVVWVVLLIALAGFYIVGYVWVRTQARAVEMTRRRVSAILVAGDLLQEEFELSNRSHLPLLWAEFTDFSTVPNYPQGRIAACEGESAYRWRNEVLCQRRGLFRLGPHRLLWHDPFGLFAVTMVNAREDVVLIYPRVVHLPPVELPRGNSQGGGQQRRPMLGNLPAATVSEYQAGDSLRHVHWASTARRGRMMVKDLEIEPAGNVWIALDLDARVHQGEGDASTLEQGVVVAASLAAELLGGRDQRAVGLWAFGRERDDAGTAAGDGLVEVLPAVGSAHIWPILTALAPVTAGNLPLAALLASSRNRIGRRSTLVVITAVPGAEEQGEDAVGDGLDWIAELVHLRGLGVSSSVVLIAPATDETKAAAVIQGMLARMDIPCTVMVAGATLPALLTFRRRRRIVRTTPTGGVVSYEVDEEVG